MRDNIGSRIGVNIVIFFVFTLFIYRSIITSNLLQYGIILMSIMCFLLWNGGKVYLHKSGYDLLLILAILYFVFAIRARTSANIYQFILYVLMVLFFWCARTATGNFRNITNMIVFCSMISATTVILQWLLPEQFNRLVVPLFNTWNQEYIYTIFSHGYYMGFNNLVGDTAGYLVMAILVILAGFQIGKDKNIWHIIMFCVLCFALLLTGKRAHVLFLLATYVVMILAKNWDKQLLIRVLKIIGIFAVIVGICVAAVIFMPDVPVVVRLVETYENLMHGEDISSGRDMLYFYALQLFANNWIFGIGWDIFPVLTTSSFGYEAAHDVNNSYLQLLCETGVVGTVIFLLPMFIMFFKALGLTKKWAKKQIVISDLNAQILLFCIGYQSFFWMYFYTESPMYDTIYLYTYFVTMAFVYALDKEQRALLKEKRN